VMWDASVMKRVSRYGYRAGFYPIVAQAQSRFTPNALAPRVRRSASVMCC
jgi:hypothetical protein